MDMLVTSDNSNTTLITLTDLVTRSSEYVFEDPTQRKILAVFVILAAVIGIPGNILVIIAVALSKKLHTKTNAFVVNLACSDLITALVLPFQAVALLNGRWPLPDIVCTIVGGIVFVGIGSSIFNLAMIAINRYYLITQPRSKYDRLYTKRNLIIMLVIAWVFPIAVAIIPPLCGVGAIGYSERYKICSAVSTDLLASVYSILGSVIGGLPCLIIIVVCYLQIFRFIRLKNPVSFRSSVVAEGKVNVHSRRSSTTHAVFKRQVRVTKNMFLVVCMYLIVIMPFTIASLIPGIHHVIPWVSSVLLLNCCVNPILYGLNHPQFRTVFGKIFRCKLQEIQEPSKLLQSITYSTASTS